MTRFSSLTRLPLLSHDDYRMEFARLSGTDVLDREARYLLNTYARYPVVMSHGEGVFLFDVGGRRYLDLMTGLGVSALGHGHPRLSRVIAEQAPKLIHLSNLYTHSAQVELAERLCRLAGMEAAFFSNGGAEALEGAMKLARSWARQNFSTDKQAFIALEQSYHGRSFGAVSVTGQPKYREQFGAGVGPVRFVPRNDIAALRAAMADDVCAILLEPVQGEGGVAGCSQEFLREARLLADRHNSLVIYDEIQCGLGRLGRWFAWTVTGVPPDVLVLGKPLGGGLPLSAFLVAPGKDIRYALGIGQHGSTLGGSPLACRMGLEFLAIMEQENILDRIQDTGAALRHELLTMAEEFPIATQARGAGAMQALQLKIPARPLVEAGLGHGLLLNAVQGNILRFLPPYILERRHVDELAAKLRTLLQAAEQTTAAREPALAAT